MGSRLVCCFSVVEGGFGGRMGGRGGGVGAGQLLMPCPPFVALFRNILREASGAHSKINLYKPWKRVCPSFCLAYTSFSNIPR